MISNYMISKHCNLWVYCVSAKAPMRLTLLYLCNEIVQTCKRKHATAFKDSFKEVILEATTLVRWVNTFVVIV